ncbi:hypothetical protein INR49_011071 [Caranx melampygus]|nr:hypothetical protein INR49_011071 [Caranx melampygus]
MTLLITTIWPLCLLFMSGSNSFTSRARPKKFVSKSSFIAVILWHSSASRTATAKPMPEEHPVTSTLLVPMALQPLTSRLRKILNAQFKKCCEQGVVKPKRRNGGLFGVFFTIANSSELSFCTETEQCLLFDPVCRTEEYQVRHYSSVKWVSTDETSFFMEFASMKAFRRLYEYITGANDKEKKIQMTSPVLVRMPDKRFWQMGVYTMSFLLPADCQINPPKPTDSKVYIQTMPDMHVYSRSYGGWMTSSQDSSVASDLSKALDMVVGEVVVDVRAEATAVLWVKPEDLPQSPHADVLQVTVAVEVADARG